MNPPFHHCDLPALLDFAAGNAPDALVLAVACHLGQCAPCRQQVDHLDRLAGDTLAPPDPLALRAEATNARDRLISQAATPSLRPTPARTNPDLEALGLPQVLRHYLPTTSGLRWKFLVPGVRSIDLVTETAGAVARVVCFRPGFVVPPHDHGGVEYTVVLSGHFDDPQSRYAAGDFCQRNPGDRHDQRIGTEEPCVAVAVNCGELLPLTPLGRLMKLLGRV